MSSALQHRLNIVLLLHSPIDPIQKFNAIKSYRLLLIDYLVFESGCEIEENMKSVADFISKYMPSTYNLESDLSLKIALYSIQILKELIESDPKDFMKSSKFKLFNSFMINTLK